MENIRTFLGLPLPKELKGYLFTFAAQMKNKNDAINWVKRSNLHITLNYLGETNPEDIESQSESFNNLFSRIHPLRLGLTETGIFPHANDPRVLWIGVPPYSDHLGNFKLELNNLVKQLGYEVDYRKFQPHITLGRVKSISRKSNFIHDFLTEKVNEIDFEVNQVVWYKSTLTPIGANYEALKVFNFKTGGQ